MCVHLRWYNLSKGEDSLDLCTWRHLYFPNAGGVEGRGAGGPESISPQQKLLLDTVSALYGRQMCLATVI